MALTVTDNSGDTNTTSSDITIVNTAPTASFTASSQNLTASFTSTSTDPDGTVAAAAWDFGDTTVGTGLTASHTYGTAGTYQVTLTVTDSDGATNTTVQPIVITSQYAADTFERTVVNGLGTADLGGAWTLSGAATSFAVNGGTGRISGVVSGNRSAYLAGVHQTDFDTKADLSLDTAATGGGVYTSLITRRVSNGNDYRLKLRYTAGGGVMAFLTRTVGGTETVLSSTTDAGVTVAPGDVMKVRFQALGTGPTTLKAKVWPQGAAEPATWLLSTTDSTAALAAPGDLGVLVFTSGSWTGPVPTVSVDNIVSGADLGTPGNIAPTASFTSSSSDHTATLTSTSNDPDGSITSSAWTFGDNTTGTGASVQHTYATAGTYTVTLTVTDNNGATSTVSQPVTVTNVAPTAAFTTSASFHTVTFTSTSSDADGTLVSYLWTFDDGTFGSGATNTHLYADAGTYNAALTVTDNDGATNTVIVPITVSDAPPNTPPIASFTSSVNGHTASFTSTSSDPDGTIASTAWTFGDTNNGTGDTTSHTYTAAGSYPVTVTVTDNNGAMTTAAGTVVITDTYASDLFERTVAGGLGTADVGGPWTISGTAANFSVSGGTGRILGTVSANRAGYVTGVHQTDLDTRADLSLDSAATGGGTYVSVISRRVSSGNDYRLKLRYTASGAITAYLTRTVGGTETVLSSTNVTGLTVAPEDVLSVRFQVTGTNPTTLRAKVWRQGAAEPATWLLTNTDSTAALAAPGDIGILHYVSGSWTGAAPTVAIDNLSTTSPLAG